MDTPDPERRLEAARAAARSDVAHLLACATGLRRAVRLAQRVAVTTPDAVAGPGVGGGAAPTATAERP